MRFRIEYMGLFAVLWVTYDAPRGRQGVSERVCMMANPPRPKE